MKYMCIKTYESDPWNYNSEDIFIKGQTYIAEMDDSVDIVPNFRIESPKGEVRFSGTMFEEYFISLEEHRDNKINEVLK